MRIYPILRKRRYHLRAVWKIRQVVTDNGEPEVVDCMDSRYSNASECNSSPPIAPCAENDTLCNPSELPLSPCSDNRTEDRCNPSNPCAGNMTGAECNPPDPCAGNMTGANVIHLIPALEI